jgi:hypothetical protein
LESIPGLHKHLKIRAQFYDTKPYSLKVEKGGREGLKLVDAETKRKYLDQSKWSSRKARWAASKCSTKGKYEFGYT